MAGTKDKTKALAIAVKNNKAFNQNLEQLKALQKWVIQNHSEE